MSPHYPLLVPGAAAAGEPRAITAPFDDSVIATIDTADAAAVDRALETADALFRDRDAWLSPAQRIDILQKTAALMRQRREELTLEAAREGGKPYADFLHELC